MDDVWRKSKEIPLMTHYRRLNEKNDKKAQNEIKEIVAGDEDIETESNEIEPKVSAVK